MSAITFVINVVHRFRYAKYVDILVKCQTSIQCFLLVVQSASTLLLGVQQNNKMLAVALQAEKEKLGHANVMILQLKRERQALFLHLILLKRKLKEQEAAASEVHLDAC